MQKLKFRKIEKADHSRPISLQLTAAQVKTLYNALLLDTMTDEPRDQDAAELLHTLREYIETRK